MEPSDLKSCSTQRTDRSLAESTQRTNDLATSTTAAARILWMRTVSLRTDGEIATSETPSPLPNGKQNNPPSTQKFLDELYTLGTNEPAEGPKSDTSKNTKKNVRKRSRCKRVRNKPTPLTFYMLEDKSHVAICQLVLCNISEVSLNFKIKCIPGGNIVAAPVGNAHIAPHSQVRLRLTWTKVDDLANWDELDAPKLLLITNFMDENDEEGESVTQTRLEAKISLSKKCNAINAPVEQLLLDAVGKSTEVSPFQKAMSSESPMPTSAGSQNNNHAENNSLSRQFADFINGLTDRSLLIIAAIFVALLVLFK